MIDSVLKGTGNSRFLKSAVPAGTSWADALAMLQAGTFPIDFNGINTEGFQQVGTPLNKANLLKDATAAQIGLPSTTTPDGMFQALGNTGELHVWKKTVVTAAEIPAGYTLGSAEANVVIAEINNGYGNYEVTITYGTSVHVSDAGIASSSGTTSFNTLGILTWGDGSNRVNTLRGKFCKVSSGQGTVESRLFYVPNNATLTYKTVGVNNQLILSSLQPVNPYPLTPAGTTTTYPVSTNPKAYQEGDDAKEAGYVLGDSTNVLISELNGGTNPMISYAQEISVSGNGEVSLGTTGYGYIRASSIESNFDSLRGKFIQTNYTSGSTTEYPDKSLVFFIPLSATLTYTSSGSNKLYRVDCQPVTGYAAIPTGTTIEYLGKLGDKARVQVVSYVGTGTNSSETPNSLVFDFAPKIVFILCWINTNSNFCQGMLSPLLDHGFFMISGYSGHGDSAYLTVKSSGNKITWTGKDPYYQLNESGAKYYAVAIG